MTGADIAWAAGLFEGEGCISVMERPEQVLLTLRLTLEMTDEDVVSRFCSVVQCGRVKGPLRYNRPDLVNRKPTYLWMISNRADIERILTDFMPWLGSRRSAKAQLVLDDIAKLNMQCESCGTTFRSHRISSRFCGKACRNRAHYLNRRAAEPSKVGRPRTI